MTAEASLVIVCYDMTPQLRRTLISLAPACLIALVIASCNILRILR